MRIATWNVNSIRARQERVSALLERENLDVLAIQETKCRPQQFPYEPFTTAGYEVAVHGINQWNGVAIISRVGLKDVQRDFPGQPAYANPGKEPVVEPRALGAICGGVRIFSLYVPNGRELSHPHYRYKLAWLTQLREYASSLLLADSQAQISLMGDWNIAPFDQDVWDMEVFADSTHVSAPEREAFFAFEDAGFTEVTRNLFDQYTYWDYKQLRFPRNQGMRIDFAYCSPALATRVKGAKSLREERKGKGASDHVPVILEVSL
ncbi:exodeoxyribonuclease III [Varibaculum vaginae]|uniref:exodeoxyribonuclease III n=1 Tax=Varibaculum vaginae TaxID=2364797 RepID=UPI000F082331|nr:exodeoxyribonuclease III [Varibaculum vaginae]